MEEIHVTLFLGKSYVLDGFEEDTRSAAFNGSAHFPADTSTRCPFILTKAQQRCDHRGALVPSPQL